MMGLHRSVGDCYVEVRMSGYGHCCCEGGVRRCYQLIYVPFFFSAVALLFCAMLLRWAVNCLVKDVAISVWE
jgi:hypothetical protein